MNDLVVPEPILCTLRFDVVGESFAMLLLSKMKRRRLPKNIRGLSEMEA